MKQGCGDRVWPVATSRLNVSLLQPEQTPACVRYIKKNKTHLQPWSSIHPVSHETETYWEARLREVGVLHQYKKEALLGVWLQDNTALIGMIHCFQVLPFPWNSGLLSYHVDASFEGQGLMFEALFYTLSALFNDFDLQVLRAYYLENNQRSQQLLQRLGFQDEGIARRYQSVNGAWQDHRVASLLREEKKEHV